MSESPKPPKRAQSGEGAEPEAKTAKPARKTRASKAQAAGGAGADTKASKSSARSAKATPPKGGKGSTGATKAPKASKPANAAAKPEKAQPAKAVAPADPAPEPGSAPAAEPAQTLAAVEQPQPPARPRKTVYVLSILVLVGVAGLGFLMGSWDRRNEPRALLSQAFALVAEADTDVQAVDATLALGLRAERSAIASASKRVPGGRERLLAALDHVNRAQKGLKGRDVERSRALRKAALGRIAMFKAAALLLPEQERAATAFGEAEGGWDAVRRAGALADEAAEAFNTHTSSGVTSSTELTIRAESELSAADRELRSAGQTMPEADFGRMLEYVAGKRRSAAASRRIDEVWLSGDIDQANRLLAERAERDAPLDVLLAGLPKSAGEAVAAAHAELTSALAEDYATGERLAREGDERLQEIRLAQPSE